MSQFEVERNRTMRSKSQKTKELLMQIEAMQRFYGFLGLDSENIKKIFKLTLGFLEGTTSQLELKSFFEALMKQNKLLSEKELNLLVCFDELIDKHKEDIKILSDDDDEVQQEVA